MAVEKVLKLGLPWRTLRRRLVRPAANNAQLVDYHTSFEELSAVDISSTRKVIHKTWCHGSQKINSALCFRLHCCLKLYTLTRITLRLFFDGWIRITQVNAVLPLWLQRQSVSNSILKLILCTGILTMDEFEKGCILLNQHMGNPLTEDQIRDLAVSLDINKDGKC